MNEDTQRTRVEFCDMQALRGILSSLPGKRVTLMGLGQFGGGQGAAIFLADRGAMLTVTDLKPAEQLSATLKSLGNRPIRYRLGCHIARDFVDADLVVANPAVPRTSALLRRAVETGVPVTSPMNMFLALCPAPVVGVTGSNGKSTTTAMVGAMLRRAGGKVWVGGNIGGSLLTQLGAMSRDGTVVLELSSFQLEDAAALRWSPHVAVVTNLTPNHLDRHGTFERYVSAKKNICAFQSSQDTLVLNACDPFSMEWAGDGLGGQRLFFNARGSGDELVEGTSLVGDRIIWRRSELREPICSRRIIALPGLHNVENALAAATAARQLGARPAHIREALAGFRALEHRLQFIGQAGGIRIYDDSLSTTPESTIAALRSMSPPLTLIAGGYDKNLSVTPLASVIARTTEVLVTIGQMGPALAQRTREAAVRLGSSPTVREAGSLQEAVGDAMRLSMPGTAVLFSPGCASYDMFDNCEHRAEVFKLLVKDYTGPHKSALSGQHSAFSS